MSSRIEDLDPWTRAKAQDFLRSCASVGLRVRITQTRRTLDEQQHLYHQGRMYQNGAWIVVDWAKVVTKAAPGTSAHNFGMAFDICFEGADPYLDAYLHEHAVYDPRWAQVGEIGEKLGLSWGGPRGSLDRFTWDRPHFERPDWKVASGRLA